MRNLKQFDTRAMRVEDIATMLPTITIFEKIEYSGITKEQIKQKLDHLYKVQIPNRTVLLNMDTNELAFYWFKNWLHPSLKHWVYPSPKDKRGCSKRVLENDLKQDTLHFYENGQQNFDYTLQDIKNFVGYEDV